jgi:hypothetical protein
MSDAPEGTMTKETKDALASLEACQKIIKALDPLTKRGKARILRFFLDQAQDPDSKGLKIEGEVFEKVAQEVGVTL